MEIAEVNIAKELTHVHCGSKTARCQAKEGRQAEEVSVLCRGNLSEVGAGEQTSEGCACAEGEGLSVSLLQM
jgi:hypothetical protein